MTMPRQAAGLCGSMHRTKNVCAAGRAAQTQIERELVQKQSRCRQVPRRQSDVSDLSAPETSGGLHSDPLAGICTPFRLSTQRADGTVCRYLICGFLPILKYHIRRGFARWWGEKYWEEDWKLGEGWESSAFLASPRGRAKGKGSLDEALSEGKLRGPSGGVSCEHYGSTIKFRAQPRDPAKRSRG